MWLSCSEITWSQIKQKSGLKLRENGLLFIRKVWREQWEDVESDWDFENELYEENKQDY